MFTLPKWLMALTKRNTLIFLLLAFFTTGFGQSKESECDKVERMQWFKDARLGIFIHWGIYSVNGIDESWSFFNGYISHEDYMKQLEGFTASAYKPNEWAKLIKESGARYAVLTTKHHDGLALWDTKFGDMDVLEKTPVARDLVDPFCKAMRKNKLKVGLYYSLLDWSHPDYPNFTKNKKRYTGDSLRWASFTKYNHGQIKEIAKAYKPDLVWFDGDWEQSAEMWDSPKIREILFGANKNVIINSRLQGYGDYATPEQGLPIHKPKDKYWELCMTMNDSWGYQGNDKNYKSTNKIIGVFAECLAMGGNLLLDIAPKPDGSIPAEQVKILKELGRWTNKHSSAIFGTEAGLPPGYFYGPSTLSSDSTILHLFLPYSPKNQVMLKGVKNKINRIWVVGNGTKLEHKTYLKPYWSDKPGLVFIDVPENTLDKNMTVIAVLLDGKLELGE
jgi:alpha-L-fucosidase